MTPAPSPDLVAIVHAIARPAALLDNEGVALGNDPFLALGEADRQGRVGWRETMLPCGLRLVVKPAADAERLYAQERFLATLSHEIRTPLNGVLGMAGLLERTRLDGAQKDYLRALRASGEHLIGLVNDVLDYAKLDSGRLELELAPTDLEPLVQGVAELLSPRARDGGIEIAWAVEAGLPPVLADDGRLRQVLFNLAGNAVKLTKAGGVLLTAARAPAPSGALRVRFTVLDTGPGLSRDAQQRVFEEFVQTVEGAAAGGTGLGLAIVKRLAGAFGGAVGVDSEPGEGARFWFEAPFDVAGPGAPGIELAGRCVAIVSPSAIVRDAAIRQVEACGGTALTFPNLAEAGSRAPAGAVLLVDPAEPRLNRRPPAPPAGRPVLVLLAPDDRDRIERYRAAGYAGYLIKPLRRASIAARVLAVLSPASVVPSTAPPANEDERAAPAAACGARVLLAEDNPVNAMLARALLAREGCSVERVSNGEEAIEAATAAPFDIILMDMRMPVMDGLAATRALRQRGVKIPVVALTANAFEDDRRACLDAGMNDFLSKPIEPAALRAALTRWTSGARGAKLAS
jgi:signal transduction histidine kinase/CheY-like chemotaxis protein